MNENPYYGDMGDDANSFDVQGDYLREDDDSSWNLGPVDTGEIDDFLKDVDVVEKQFEDLWKPLADEREQFAQVADVHAKLIEIRAEAIEVREQLVESAESSSSELSEPELGDAQRPARGVLGKLKSSLDSL